MIYNLLEKDHPMVHMRMKEENQPEDKVEFARVNEILGWYWIVSKPSWISIQDVRDGRCK